MQKVRVYVEDIATILASYDHVEIGRAATQADAAAQSGTFIDLGPVVALGAGIEEYAYVDLNGAVNQWYSTRYAQGSTYAPWTTPFQARTMGYIGAAEFRDYGLTTLSHASGVAYTDDELDRHLATSSRLIDGYLNGMGFQLTQDIERHVWRQDTRRVYPYQRPIVSADGLVVYVSNQQHATFQPGDLFVNYQASYIEVISLNAVTYSLFPAIVNLGLINPVAELTYTHGYAIPPQDVKDATALTCVELLGEIALNEQGMSGLTQLMVDKWRATRKVGGDQIPGLDVPQAARRLIDHYVVLTLR